MKKKNFVGFVLIGLVVGACSFSGESDYPSPVASLDELNSATTGFVTMRFDNYRKTTVAALGGDANIDDCRLVADVVHTSDVIKAWSFEEPAPRMLSFCDRCFYSDDGTKTNCVMPEWQYHVPEDSQQEFAVFFTLSTRSDGPDILTALFAIEGDEVDMTPIPGGERVALEDMESYLQAFNTDPDNEVFLP